MDNTLLLTRSLEGLPSVDTEGREGDMLAVMVEMLRSVVVGSD